MPRGAQVVHNRLPIGMQKFVGFLAGTWCGTDKPVRFAHPFALKIEDEFKKRTTGWLSRMRIGLLWEVAGSKSRLISYPDLTLSLEI